MATKATPAVASKSTVATPINQSPAISLVTPSANQVPVHSTTVVVYSAGEQPIHFVQMKDGTVVPVPENQIKATGGMVVY